MHIKELGVFVRFHHNHKRKRHTTQCFLELPCKKGEEPVVLGKGKAYHNKADQYDPGVGRKVSLKRAFKDAFDNSCDGDAVGRNFSREERTLIWTQLLGQTRGPHNPKRRFVKTPLIQQPEPKALTIETYTED